MKTENNLQGKQSIPLIRAPSATYRGSNPEARKLIKDTVQPRFFAQRRVIIHSEAPLFRYRQYLTQRLCCSQHVLHSDDPAATAGSPSGLTDSMKVDVKLKLHLHLSDLVR